MFNKRDFTHISMCVDGHFTVAFSSQWELYIILTLRKQIYKPLKFSPKLCNILHIADKTYRHISPGYRTVLPSTPGTFLSL